jgi:diguanylate cyclase (GGDEF)-like protein
MNFYGLPEFIAYTMLLGIAYVLIRQEKQERLRYWLVGWGLVFLHSAIFMLFAPQFPFDVLARGTLALAGQAFILAAFHQEPTNVSHSQLAARIGLSATLNLTFAIASAIYGDLQSTGPSAAPFYVLIGAGAASTLGLAALDRSNPESRFPISVALTVLVYALQAWLLHAYGVLMASQWLMCWTYLAVAYFFLARRTKLSMGVVFTAVSFVLWGLVFPVYSLLMIYAPEISHHIESEVWNLPKFLAAASMILALLEERVSSATRLATHDELTGLPNRRLYVDRFEQAVARAARSRAKFAVLVIDLNRFKLVNDTLGHQAGDEVLREASSRLRSALRQTDTLARTGGDEFTVIVDGVRSRPDAEFVSESLQRRLDAPIVLGGRAYRASASVGIAIYPDDGTTQTGLQAVADERMYARKDDRQAGAAKAQFRFGQQMGDASRA